MVNRLQRYMLIVVILLIGLAFWVQNLNRPFVGHFDQMDTAWTLYADHTLEYGILGVRFGDVYNVAPTTFDSFAFTNFHPPMLTDLLLPGRAFLGDHELATRITPVFISLLAAAAICALAERLFRGTGPFALFFFIFIPTVMYYSNITTQELVNLLWITLALWNYSHWLEDPAPKWRNRLFVLALLGGWTDWVYYFFVIFLLLHALWAVGWKRARGLSVQLLALAATGLFYLAVNLWQNPNFVQSFLGEMFGRLTDTTASSDIVPTGYPGFGGYLVVMMMYIFQMFTPILLLLTGFAAFLLRKEWRRPIREAGKPRRRAWLVQWTVLLLPVATTLLFMLVLQREAHYLHDFLLYHFAIPFAILSAYAFRTALFSSGRPSATGLALMGVLVVLFLYSALYQFGVLKTYDYLPQRQEWGELIRPYVHPGEKIGGNVAFSYENLRNAFGLTMGYYAGTDATWSVPYETAAANGFAGFDFYVYCMPTVSDPDLDPGAPLPLPPALKEAAVTVFMHDGCWFADLKK